MGLRLRDVAVWATASAVKPGAAGRHTKKPKGERVLDYIRNAAEIYRQSFAAIREETDLTRFPALVQGWSG